MGVVDILRSYSLENQEWNELPPLNGLKAVDRRNLLMDPNVADRFAHMTLKRQHWYHKMNGGERADAVRKFSSKLQRLPRAVQTWSEDDAASWPSLSQKLYKTIRVWRNSSKPVQPVTIEDTFTVLPEGEELI